MPVLRPGDCKRFVTLGFMTKPQRLIPMVIKLTFTSDVPNDPYNVSCCVCDWSFSVKYKAKSAISDHLTMLREIGRKKV
jgi:hypothetical protein